MRRVLILASLVAVMALSLVVVGRTGVITLAQEGTPGTEGTPAEEGVFAGARLTFLGIGTAEQLPAAPVDFGFARITLEPGASFPVDASDPSVALGLVEAGTFTLRVEAPIQITRAATIAAFSTPGVDPSAVPTPEAIPAGTEFTMTVGDSAVFPPSVDGEVRNDGQETAVLLLASLEPHEGSEGTPTS